MSRSLAIPAVLCLFAFAALLAALQATTGWRAEPAAWAAESRRADVDLSPASRATPGCEAANCEEGPLSQAEAEQLLTSLTGEYLRPWREWEDSPHRVYSRAYVRPIHTISAEVAVAPEATGPSGSFVATIVVTSGEQSQAVPCVVDRTTQQVRLFAEGEWVTPDAWLKLAPLPYAAR